MSAAIFTQPPRVIAVLSVSVAMADSVHDLWRTRLCRHGPDCRHPQCVFAHRLCDLRSPNEVHQHYDVAWRQGVDRWYGQAMTPDQLQIIRKYYQVTPPSELPIWGSGVFFYHVFKFVEFAQVFMQSDSVLYVFEDRLYPEARFSHGVLGLAYPDAGLCLSQ